MGLNGEPEVHRFAENGEGQVKQRPVSEITGTEKFTLTVIVHPLCSVFQWNYGITTNVCAEITFNADFNTTISPGLWTHGSPSTCTGISECKCILMCPPCGTEIVLDTFYPMEGNKTTEGFLSN